jgi:hypothetical protein
LWDVQTGESRYIFEGHTREVRACAFSPNGQYALSVSDDNVLRVWDVQTGKTAICWRSDSSLRCIAIDSEGRHVVAGDLLGALHFLTIEAVPMGPAIPPIVPIDITILLEMEKQVTIPKKKRWFGIF